MRDSLFGWMPWLLVRGGVRRWGLVVAGVLVAGTLAGCGGAKGVSMTPQEARDTLVQTVKDTAALLPRVTGWSQSFDPQVGSCGLGWGATGANYGYIYGAPQPGGDHAADVKTVADYWRQLGMNVRIVEQGGPTVYATGGSVQGLSFSTAPGNYVIAGTSLCVPGDANALRRDQ